MPFAPRHKGESAVLPIADNGRLWAERSVEWGLNAYDCCCLELARRQRIALATKDDELAAAARRIGVPLHLS